MTESVPHSTIQKAHPIPLRSPIEEGHLADITVRLATEDDVMWVEPPLPALSAVNDSNRARVGVETVWQAPYDLDGSGARQVTQDGD